MNDGLAGVTWIQCLVRQWEQSQSGVWHAIRQVSSCRRADDMRKASEGLGWTINSNDPIENPSRKIFVLWEWNYGL